MYNPSQDRLNGSREAVGKVPACEHTARFRKRKRSTGSKPSKPSKSTPSTAAAGKKNKKPATGKSPGSASSKVGYIFEELRICYSVGNSDRQWDNGFSTFASARVQEQCLDTAQNATDVAKMISRVATHAFWCAFARPVCDFPYNSFGAWHDHLICLSPQPRDTRRYLTASRTPLNARLPNASGFSPKYKWNWAKECNLV